MTHELSILNGTGDLKITWDHNDPASVAKAREEVKKLKAAGYRFFLVGGEPADELAAGQGELVARIATEEEIIGAPEAESPAAEAEQPKKRGRKGVPNKTRAVAVPPLRGG